MSLNLLIFMKTAIGYKKINNKTFNDGESTYGLRKIEKPRQNMTWMFYLICCLGLITTPVYADGDYFPGLRRPPVQFNPLWQAENAEAQVSILKTISELIEEQARRRFLDHLQRTTLGRNGFQSGPSEPDSDDGQEFSFQMPFDGMVDLSDPINFAVGPSDPRFYDSTTTVKIKNALNEENEVAEVSDFEDVAESDQKPIKVKEPVMYYKPKAPMNVNPKIIHESDNNDNDRFSNYDESSQSHRSGVIQRPLEVEGAMGMYIVALIAGVSAAITVGLISVGIGWYTLHKKSKAAADVEYPAYGVTGPNKDMSPSGDRRLAQSAQMYHYQHQKQQIIAMENHQNGEKHSGLSEAESDEEEGDYTVYECPGPAQCTGEMEVKNPLFLDDPTPATPATNQQQDKKGQTNTITIANPPVFKTEIKQVNEK